MCYDMRRFEKIAEEKKRHQKKQEIGSIIEEKPEILIDSSSRSDRSQKG